MYIHTHIHTFIQEFQRLLSKFCVLSFPAAETAELHVALIAGSYIHACIHTHTYLSSLCRGALIVTVSYLWCVVSC